MRITDQAVGLLGAAACALALALLLIQIARRHRPSKLERALANLRAVAAAGDRVRAARSALATPAARPATVRGGKVRRGAARLALPPSRRLRETWPWTAVAVNLPDGEALGAWWVRVGGRPRLRLFDSALSDEFIVPRSADDAVQILLRSLDDRYSHAFAGVRRWASERGLQRLLRSRRRGPTFAPDTGDRPYGSDLWVRCPEASSLARPHRADALRLERNDGSFLIVRRVSLGRRWKPTLALFDSWYAGKLVPVRPASELTAALHYAIHQELEVAPWRDRAVPPPAPPAEPKNHPRRWLALIVASLSSGIIGLEATVLNGALPEIEEKIDASWSTLSWIVNAYTLAALGVTLIGAKLADGIGRKLVWKIGLAILAGASVLAVRASHLDGIDIAGHILTDDGVLIAARAGLGVAGGLIVPATNAALKTFFVSPFQRLVAVAIWSAIGSVAIVVGPLAGGRLLRGDGSWESIFWMNVAAAVVLFLMSPLMPETKARGAGRTDWLGCLLAAGGATLLVWGVVEAPDKGWTTPHLLAGVIALLLFAIWQRPTWLNPFPLITRGLFWIPSFVGVSLFLALVYSIFGGGLYVLTHFLQHVRGLDAEEAGGVLFRGLWYLVPASLIAVGLVKWLGARVVVITGMVLLGAGLLVLSRTSPAGPDNGLHWALVLIGVGVGAALAAARAEGLAHLDDDQAAVGAGLLRTLEHFGLALGVAFTTTILSSVYSPRMADPVRSIPDPAAAAKAQEQVGFATGLADRLGLDWLRTDAAEAFVPGMNRAFLVFAVMALLAAAAGLLLPGRPPRGAQQPKRPAPPPPPVTGGGSRPRKLSADVAHHAPPFPLRGLLRVVLVVALAGLATAAFLTDSVFVATVCAGLFLGEVLRSVLYRVSGTWARRLHPVVAGVTAGIGFSQPSMPGVINPLQERLFGLDKDELSLLPAFARLAAAAAMVVIWVVARKNPESAQRFMGPFLATGALGIAGYAVAPNAWLSSLAMVVACFACGALGCLQVRIPRVARGGAGTDPEKQERQVRAEGVFDSTWLATMVLTLGGSSLLIWLMRSGSNRVDGMPSYGPLVLTAAGLVIVAWRVLPVLARRLEVVAADAAADSAESDEERRSGPPIWFFGAIGCIGICVLQPVDSQFSRLFEESGIDDPALWQSVGICLIAAALVFTPRWPRIVRRDPIFAARIAAVVTAAGTATWAVGEWVGGWLAAMLATILLLELGTTLLFFMMIWGTIRAVAEDLRNTAGLQAIRMVVTFPPVALAGAIVAWRTSDWPGWLIAESAFFSVVLLVLAFPVARRWRGTKAGSPRVLAATT